MQKTITLILLLTANILSAQNWIDTSFNILTESDITYGVSANFAGRIDTLQLDVSYPENDVPPECGRPLMLIIHGGAWLTGDKNEGYPRVLRQDFAKRGYVTASINYRLGQFHTNQYINCNIPEWNCFNMTDSSEFYRANHRAIQDANGAIRYLINHASNYQINPNNVFVVGESAGGFVAIGVGFIDDDSEVLNQLTGAYPDAPAPNELYENACIRNYGLADNISDMDLSRPDLGNWKGELNYPLLEEYEIQAVGNFYGGAFNNIFESFSDSSPSLYLYHQPCDLIVPYNYNKILSGYNNCLTQFPTFCGHIVNCPYVYGSKGVKEIIDTLMANSIPTSDYYFDNSNNNYSCLQQLDPNLACHAIDYYWLRTTNMATYFANSIDSCIVDTSIPLEQNLEHIIHAVYPNPANDLLHIRLNQEISHASIEIVNIIGETISTHHYGHLIKTQIDLRGIEKGAYILLLRYNNKTARRIFVKN